MKKWLGMTSIVLSMSLIAAGCGAEKSATQTPVGSTEPGATEKPIEITWANDFNSPEADGNYVQKQIEAKFNVKITNVKLERASWKDKFNVLLASGQIPDIFPIDANETDMAGWA
ncbi:hypothetical protein AB4Z22_25225, partial [Paenibacillus sp. TAF58]